MFRRRRRPADDFTRYARWLTRITYKPGWEFSIGTNESDEPTLIVEFQSHDAYEADRCLPVRAGQDIPSTYDFEHFAKFVYQLINHTEQHESDEWFRIDGLIAKDPHAASPKPTEIARIGP